jgi:hypothetical protein
MGVVHALAVLVPTAFGRTFPWAILTLGIAYLVAGPWFYWRPVDDGEHATADDVDGTVDENGDGTADGNVVGDRSTDAET